MNEMNTLYQNKFTVIRPVTGNEGHLSFLDAICLHKTIKNANYFVDAVETADTFVILIK